MKISKLELFYVYESFPYQRHWHGIACCKIEFIFASEAHVLFCFRPWSNDQTLFVKHLKLACQAKCFTVWPRSKIMIVKHFLVPSSKNVFVICKNIAQRIRLNYTFQAMFCDVVNI